MYNYLTKALIAIAVCMSSLDVQAGEEGVMNQQELFGGLSSPLEVPIEQCGLVPIIHLIKYPGCEPKTISSFACKGYCNSYVQPSGSKFWQLERSCSCCQHSGQREASIKLDCPGLDPPTRTVKTKAPVECLCRACLDINKEDIKAQELLEALAEDNE